MSDEEQRTHVYVALSAADTCISKNGKGLFVDSGLLKFSISAVHCDLRLYALKEQEFNAFTPSDGVNL